MRCLSHAVFLSGGGAAEWPGLSGGALLPWTAYNRHVGATPGQRRGHAEATPGGGPADGPIGVAATSIPPDTDRVRCHSTNRKAGRATGSSVPLRVPAAWCGVAVPCGRGRGGGGPGQPHHIPSPLWHQLIVLVNYPTLLTRLRGFLEGGASCFNDALSIHYTG